MQVTYIVDDKLGGIASLIANLIDHRISDSEFQEIILLDKKESTYTRTHRLFNADRQTIFPCSAKENAYSVIRKLHHLLPREAGAVVFNDSLEMQVFDHLDSPLTTYQIVHDEYNYGLALKYAHVVDVFIAHSKLYYHALVAALPARKDTIFYLPHGVSVPAQTRTAEKTLPVMRLLFLGRMSSAKGIFDLPVIARWLDTWGIPYVLTCIGNGPELPALKEIWQRNDRVTFCSPATNKEVLALCAQHDLFVFPTQFEGTPVSLLEAMSTGLVPVITDLEGGIREIVSEDIGVRLPMGEAERFANAIRLLYENPLRLNQLSANCIELVASNFNVTRTALAYHQLFMNYASFYREKVRAKQKLGFRLDHPFLPSVVTQCLRSFK